jgi:hypothetical protein
MRYWIFQGADIKGPFSPGEIEAFGGVAPESLVCEETLSGASELDWKPAAEIGELGSALSPAAAPEPILASSRWEAPASQGAELRPDAETTAISGAWPEGGIGWSEGAAESAESMESLVFLEFGSEELLFGGSGFGFFSWADLPSAAPPAAAPPQPSPAAVAPPPPPAPSEPPAPLPSHAADDEPAAPPLHLGPARTFKLLEEPEPAPQPPGDASPPPTAAETSPMPEPRLDEEAVAMEPVPSPAPAAPEAAPLPPPAPDLVSMPSGEAAAPTAGLEAPVSAAALEGPAVEAAEPAAGATGLAASLEPAFFSAQQEAPLPAGEIGGGAELKPLGTPAPETAAAPALPQADALASSPAAASAASDSPPSLSVGPSTQEVIARLAKPQTATTKAKTPAPRKKTNQRLLFGVLATLVVLAASWYLFWQSGGPKEEGASASEASRRAPAAPMPAPIARAPQGGITPQAAQGGPASPLPVSPYPAAQAAAPVSPAPVPSEPPAPAAPDSGAQAIDLTKSYPLNGRRRSVGEWLSASFAGKRGYKEEWSASPVGADGVESPFNFLVQYRVVSASDRVEPRLYLFEVDLSRRTVKGENRLARRLWAPRTKDAPVRRAREASAGGRRHVRIEREIVIRPKAA